MNIEEALFSHMANDATIAGLTDGRIHPLVMPQGGSFPTLVYTIVNDKEHTSINRRTPYAREVRIQVDCYSKSYSESITLKDAVRESLRTFAYKTHSLNSRALAEDETRLYRQLIEFYIQG